MQLKAAKAAFPYTIPVLTGYLFLGIGLGLLMNSAGFSVGLTGLMSLLVYSGSMQYAAVPVLCSAFAPFDVFMLTLMVNARHLFYGISMLKRYPMPRLRSAYMIFAMTDETFSLNISTPPPDGVKQEDFYFWVSLLNHSYWVLATMLGNVFGAMISFSTEGVEFVMTSLFVVITAGQWSDTREHTPALIGFISSAACLAIFGAERFMLPSMACIMLLLLAFRPVLDKEDAA